MKYGFMNMWMTPAVLVTLVLASMAIPAVIAEDESATDISGFDTYSATGCTDDTVVYNSALNGIELELGSGTFEMDDFYTVTIDFYIYIVEINEPLTLTIEDEDDASGNEIVITITGTVATGGVKVDVDDVFDGGTNSKSGTGVTDIVGVFAKVDIDITETTSSTDGTKTKIDVSIGTEDLIEDFELKSNELNLDKDKRKWTDIRFESITTGHVVFVDDIAIDTSTAGRGYTVMFTLFVGGIIIIAMIYIGARTWGKRNLRKVPGGDNIADKV